MWMGQLQMTSSQSARDLHLRLQLKYEKKKLQHGTAMSNAKT